MEARRTVTRQAAIHVLQVLISQVERQGTARRFIRRAVRRLEINVEQEGKAQGGYNEWRTKGGRAGAERVQLGDKADWFELTVVTGESGRKKRAECRVLGWRELRSRLSGG